MNKTILNIEGMHCPSCEMLIEDSLMELDGIEKAEISHKKGTAKIHFDESIIGEERIKIAINREGYKAE